MFFLQIVQQINHKGVEQVSTVLKTIKRAIEYFQMGKIKISVTTIEVQKSCYLWDRRWPVPGVDTKRGFWDSSKILLLGLGVTPLAVSL